MSNWDDLSAYYARCCRDGAFLGPDRLAGVRPVRFESPTLVVEIPVSGVPGLSIRSGIELVWQRLGWAGSTPALR